MKNGNSDCAETKNDYRQTAESVIITGGFRFVGTNLADRLLSAVESVVLFDNLSRTGVEQNHNWLRRRHGDLMRLEVADVRNQEAFVA